ncbi:MAG: hypothetical protein RLZZ15_1850 [Verrucomicrobiota bacterium]|jgi:tetratricopeptide (TPR) repeat protein
MSDPATTTTAVAAGLGFLGGFLKDAVKPALAELVTHVIPGHIIGGEAHHAYRHLVEHLRERLHDGLPANHDLRIAIEESLLEAARAFALGVAATLGDKPSLWEAIRQHLADGTFSTTPTLELRDRPGQPWVDELIAESRRANQREGGIAADFILDEGQIATLLLDDRRDWFPQRVTAAFADWLDHHVRHPSRPACVDDLLKNGWAAEHGGAQRVGFYQVFALFFREKIKARPKVFNIFVAQTLSEVAREVKELRSVAVPTSAQFETWLGDQFAQLRDWLDGKFAQVLDGQAEIKQGVGAGNAKLDRVLDGQAKITELLAAPPRPIPPLHQLGPNPLELGFVGRETDLAKLRALNPAAGVVLTALHGMGGIGKTALALVLAHEWAPRFPDAQLVLDARGTQPNPPAARDLLAQVVAAFHPAGEKLPDDEGALQARYHATLHGRRVLLLVDNALDTAQVAPLRPPEGCGLIVTSRRPVMLGKRPPHDVDRLPEPHAIALLREHYPALGDADAAALAKLCAGLPLALRLAGAHLALDGETPNVAAYLRALGGGRLRALDADAKDAGEISVSDTLRLSEAQLSEEQRQAWRALGVFTASFDARAAEAIAGADEAALTAFVRRSLLEREGADRYKLHDLAADYARTQLDPAALAGLHLAHSRHYTTVGEEADALYVKKGETMAGLALFDRERAQLEAAYAWLTAQPADAAARQLTALVSAVSYTGYLRFHPRQQIIWQESRLHAARCTKDRLNEGRALNNLGNAHYVLGEARKAIGFYEQRLAIAREIGDRHGEGITLGNLGIAYKNLGDARKAIRFYEQALVVSCEIGDRCGEGRALGNLGIAHWSLGDARKASGFFEQALVVSCEIGDRRGEGNALGNLGLAHDDARKAIGFFEQHLAIAREVGDRRGEATTLGNLGIAHDDLGDARKAIGFYEQWLAIAREIGYRRGEGSALGNLGIAHRNLGDARKAIEFYEQALVIDREIGDRRGEATDLWNAAVAHDSLGNRAEAILRAAAALAIYEAIEDPSAAKVRAELAEWRGAGGAV